MSYIFGGDTGETSSSIVDARRRMALAMLQQGQDASPIKSAWQGAARVAQAVMGGLALHGQQQDQQNADAQIMSTITGQPYTPPAQSPNFLSGLFGGNKIPASDAQGQVVSSAPASGQQRAPVASAGISASPDATDLNGYLSDPAKRSTLPAGMRNNNPGNIKFVGQNVPGIVGPSQNTDEGDPQAVFATPEAGMAAMHQLLLKKYNGGKVTADQIIAGNGGWTPGNHDAAANVARYAGLAPDQDINLNDPSMATKFMRGLMMQEHGKSSGLYPDAMIASAVGGRPAVTPGQVASLDPSAGMGAPQQPYRDPMVTTAYQPPAPASPAVQAIQQQLTPEQVASGNATATIPVTGQQVGGPNALPPGPRPDPSADAAIPVGQNGQMAIPAGPLGPQRAYQPDPQQTASIAPNLPADGMGGLPTPSPQAADPRARLAAALQSAPQAGPAASSTDGQVKVAQALQGAQQGSSAGPASPLAGNPKAVALMQAMMNPNASPMARQMAGAMLQQTMQPHTQILTNPNTGTSYLVNTLTGEKTLIDQGQTADSELEKDAAGMPMGTFNKRTGQYSPLATPPQGAPGLPPGVKPTDDYYNWQIAKNGGDQRSFPDYQADMRKAGAQSVTLAGETEESKALGQARAANVVDYMKQGPDARNKMQTLQIMADALKAGNGNFSTGPGAEMILNAKQAIGNMFGTNLDGVAPAEIYKKMGAYLASSAAKDLAQRPTQFDFKTFLENNPGLDISPQGNQLMINVMQQQAQHQMDLSQLAQSYKGPSADWNDVVANYDKTHPIMSPITGKTLDPKEVMFPDPNKSTDKAPAGVDANTWKFMTPEEKKLWQ